MSASTEIRDEPALRAAAIRAARERIDPVFLDSPQYVHDGLSARAGRPVVVKVESVNPIRAFKGRGTWLAIAELVEQGSVGPEQACVVASTGNFGQGVAYAGRAMRVPAVVFANVGANPGKLARIRALGATAVEAGRDFDEARAASEAYAAAHRGTLLVDGEAPSIAAGAGTLGLEVTDGVASGSLPPIGAAYVPVGNGSLIVGVAAWLRQVSPSTRVLGIQSEAAPSMTLSWREGRPIETDSAATFADGIATRVPVPQALELMRGRVDDMILLPEAQIRAAQAELRDALGITVEGAAAASWAAVLADEKPAEGAALVIVTGSNATG